MSPRLQGPLSQEFIFWEILRWFLVLKKNAIKKKQKQKQKQTQG